MGFISAFIRNDIRNIGRDSLLVYILVVPWAGVLLIRMVLPIVDRWFTAGFGMPLTVHQPLILSFFVLEIPMMFGLVFGLLLLDERDDRVLPAIRVTSVCVENYLKYRLLSAAFLSMLYAVITVPAAGLADVTQVSVLLPAMAASSVLSVFIILVLVAFAGNKVEGLALMKAMGILLLGPVVAYFWRSNWQLLLGLLPSYWAAKAFWLSASGQGGWMYALTGAVYTLGLSWGLSGRVRRRLERLS